MFGEWQTKLFEAPPAVDGMVPRNEYGNVELFKPWMLPPGTVHVQETIPKYLIRCRAKIAFLIHVSIKKQEDRDRCCPSNDWLGLLRRWMPSCL